MSGFVTPSSVLSALVRPDLGFGVRLWPRVSWGSVQRILEDMIGIVHPDSRYLPLEQVHFLNLNGDRYTAYHTWVDWTQVALGWDAPAFNPEAPIFALRPNGLEPMTQRWLVAVMHSQCTYEEMMQITGAYTDALAHGVADRMVWPLAFRALRTRTALTLDPVSAGPALPAGHTLITPGQRTLPTPGNQDHEQVWAAMSARYGIGTVATHKSRLRRVFDLLAREGRVFPTTEVEAETLLAEAGKTVNRPDHLRASWRAFARTAASVGVPVPQVADGRSAPLRRGELAQRGEPTTAVEIPAVPAVPTGAAPLLPD